MRELLEVIPYMDITIVILLVLFLYVGWSGGVPRLLMVLGSVYTGFLLASVYYHFFAIAVGGLVKMAPGFTSDLLSFVFLDVLVTILMLALLLSVFGHIEVKGRLAAFDKLGGSLLGFVTGVLVVGILVMLLRVPYEANKSKINGVAEMPVMQLFDTAYGKSVLAPNFMRTTPYLMYSVLPLLPPETRDRGAVPLLQSLVVQQ